MERNFFYKVEAPACLHNQPWKADRALSKSRVRRRPGDEAFL
jgi:hypothetical protein